MPSNATSALSLICGRPVVASVTGTANLRAVKATHVHGRIVAAGEVLHDVEPELAGDLLTGGRFEPADDATAASIRAFSVSEWRPADKAAADKATARLVLAAAPRR
jgi:hypothetical protein